MSVAPRALGCTRGVGSAQRGPEADEGADDTASTTTG